MVSTPVLDVNEVFEALNMWIKRRPGLDPREYGCGREGFRAYRSELRSIAKDKKRALAALEEARGLDPQRPELLADSFRAFSGRLEWVPAGTPQPHMGEGVTTAQGRLEYTTGQYWPTEYRKAAASVLELYIAAWRQSEAEAHPQTFTYHSISDVKAANRSIGSHWFDTSTMRFFNTKIESGLIGGRYFITSERMDDQHPRLYTVRCAMPDGSIDTIGDFNKLRTRDEARDVITDLMKEAK